MRRAYDILIGLVHCLGRFQKILFFGKFFGRFRFVLEAEQFFFSRLEALIKKKVGVDFMLFHVASVGEFFQIEKILCHFHQKGCHCVLTYSSSSMADWIERTEIDVPPFFFHSFSPLDTAENYEKLFSLFRPKAMIVSRDIWPNMIGQARKKDIPIFLIGTKIKSESILRWTPLRNFYANLYSCFSVICALTEKDASLFSRLTGKSTICRYTGDPRFDLINQNQKLLPSKKPENFEKGFTLLAGSTCGFDEKIILPAMRDLLHRRDNLRLIVAPHDPNPKSVNKILKIFGEINSVLKWSEWSQNETFRVLIIDDIGFLSRLYRYADIAYIGGGFSTGVHNTMEPSVFGVPCVFGPRFSRYWEAVELIERGLACKIPNAEQFGKTILHLMDQTDLSERKKLILDFFESKTGSFKKCLTLIEERI